MQIRKLFKVLVAGGAILGGVVGCGGSDKSQGQTTSPTTGGDGGTNPGDGMPGGGGTHGW